MQDNTFTLKGSQSLANALQGWPALKELGVGDSLLGARGAVKVFEALAGGANEKIEILRLQYNDINPAGVKALLHAAKNDLPALRRVELNGNKFDEEDPSIEELAALLSDRKDEHGKEEDPQDHWGLDELDELEGEDSDEEEDEQGEDEEEDEEVREKMVEEDDRAENEPVTQKKDAEVDELAEALNKTL
jgi:Ran GTPase-activating protein 1